MKTPKIILLLAAWSLLVAPLAGQLNRTRTAKTGGAPGVADIRESWKVLEPITRRNLSIYPVVSNLKVDTSDFLTLDEGLAKGEVRIAERGELQNALYRPRDSRRWPPLDERPQSYDGASVNELMLVNQSGRCCCWRARSFPAANRTASSGRT
jgi:ARG and Rhodanese-Phosphatase-superfamily-associated Protein domain